VRIFFLSYFHSLFLRDDDKQRALISLHL
jgi:hypothetical protein